MEETLSLVRQHYEDIENSKGEGVGTTKNSVETSCGTWLFRKVRQVWEGGFLSRAMYLATVVWETSIPSLAISP